MDIFLFIILYVILPLCILGFMIYWIMLGLGFKMKISCLFNKHKYGKMQFEEDGSPYKLCDGCGKRQNYALRSLSELDNMQMWEVEELMGGIPVVEEVLKMAIPEPNICKICGTDLVNVEPAVVLDGLVLMECPKCGERCYK